MSPPFTELTLGLAYAEGRAMIVSGTFLLLYCLIRTLTGLNIGKLQVIEQIKHSIQDIRTGIRGSELRTSFQVVLVMVKSIFSALIKICLIAPRWRLWDKYPDPPFRGSKWRLMICPRRSWKRNESRVIFFNVA